MLHLAVAVKGEAAMKRMSAEEYEKQSREKKRKMVTFAENLATVFKEVPKFDHGSAVTHNHTTVLDDPLHDGASVAEDKRTWYDVFEDL